MPPRSLCFQIQVGEVIALGIVGSPSLGHPGDYGFILVSRVQIYDSTMKRRFGDEETLIYEATFISNSGSQVREFASSASARIVH